MTSDRTAQRLTRILAVLPWIISHDGADTDDLVDRFGYKDTTELVKDMHLVFTTGLPGYGPGDLIDVDVFDDEVYVDAADYFSRPLRLTPAEALGLLASGMTLIQSDQASPALHSAVEKLASVVVPPEGETVRFEVPTPAYVGTLKDAVASRNVVRIGYVGIATNERTERDIEGWSVFFNLGNWYLSGFCRLAEGSRVFRIDRIDTLIVLDEVYVIPEVPLQTTIDYRPSEDDQHVRFTLAPSARWVAEYYPVDVEPLDDDAIRVTMGVSDPLVAARLLLQLGETVTDIQGDEVIAVLENLRSRIVARYTLTK
ncbi:MAG: WYL domain-containing protein [Actinomycetia bacterium]|nr:WYL domain-containing protein [Actinomycetes bacterium]